MKSGLDSDLFSCEKRGWVLQMYDDCNQFGINTALSLKMDFFLIWKKRTFAAKTSYVLHYMNIGKKLTNVDHEKILLYL